jgi:hypothetical protein
MTKDIRTKNYTKCKGTKTKVMMMRRRGRSVLFVVDETL